MNNELLAVLDYLENERRIKRETLIELVEDSLLAAARKAIGPANDLRVKIDPETGDIQAWAKLMVVEEVENPESEVSYADAVRRQPDIKIGEEIEWEVTPENFGRIAAQNAKQTIMHRLRQEEKRLVCAEYEDRIGHLLSGVVIRVERGDVFVDLTRTEAAMRYHDRIPGEEYQPGDHITAILTRVNATEPGPSLFLSRSHPKLVARLFEREVSEIGEGLVEIKAVAREPGYRSKIAVHSDRESVDPVGACVGLRGSRVKTVVRELGGEKVDIIRWNPDISTFVGNALQPAKLSRVDLDEENHVVYIKAPEDQLSLAIGKKGQNARLAAKLTGWRIDISRLEAPGELEFEDKVQEAINRLVEQIPLLDAETAGRLVANGFVSVEGLLAAEAEDLADIEGIDEERAVKILEEAQKKASTE